MPTVYNQRSNTTMPPPKGAIYIGRPTIWGNPFPVSEWGGVQQSIDKYKEWIMQPEQAFLRAAMRRELKGKDLVCWCAPRICHGDIVLEIANETRPKKRRK